MGDCITWMNIGIFAKIGKQEVMVNRILWKILVSFQMFEIISIHSSDRAGTWAQK